MVIYQALNCNASDVNSIQFSPSNILLLFFTLLLQQLCYFFVYSKTTTSSYHGGLSGGPPAIKGSGPWSVYGSLDHKWQMKSFQRGNKAREVGLFSPQALNRTEKILVICPLDHG